MVGVERALTRRWRLREVLGLYLAVPVDRTVLILALKRQRAVYGGRVVKCSSMSGSKGRRKQHWIRWGA